MRDSDFDVREGSDEERASEFDLRTVFAFLRRRRLVILLVGLPLLIPATIYPFLLSHYYEATAKVTIERQAPVLEFGHDVLPDQHAQNRMPGMLEDSIITLAMSDAVLGGVLDRMAAPGPQKRSLQELAKIRLGLADDTAASPEQERQMRLELLRRTIQVGIAGGGDYILIRATGAAPGAAAFLANAVADSYVKFLAEQREAASRRAVTWLNQQIYELREQTARKEQLVGELIAQGVKPRAGDDDGQASSSLSQIESEIQDARIELLAARQRLAELAPRATVPDADPNTAAAATRVREQYAEASASLDAARLRFTPTHPEVRRLEQIVATLGAKLGGGTRSVPLTSAELSEYQTLSAERSRLEARMQVLESSRDAELAAGQKSEAYSRYRRLESELEIDRQMLEVLLTRRNETLLLAATKHTGAQLLDAAVAPLYPAGPKRKKLLVFGWVAAIGAGFGVALLLELLDRRMRDTDRIAQVLGFPTLGIVTTLRAKDAVPERQGELGPGSPSAEGYRALRTALVFAMRDRKIQTLLVTSALAGAGKTTTTTNLAAVFARMGKRVLLVDADLRRPRVHRVFNLARAPGLADVLKQTARPSDVITRPDGAQFDVMPAGASPENPTELLGSLEWAQLMADLRAEYDLILLDSPVLLAVPDALLLSADADGVLLVHKPGSLERRGLERVRIDLRRSGARVLGVVFNRIDPLNTEVYPSYLESPYTREEQPRKAFWR